MRCEPRLLFTDMKPFDMSKTTELTPLIGMNLDELQRVVVAGGMPRFVGKQLADWIYAKRVTGFEQMANISIKNKEWLSTFYTVGRYDASRKAKSADGTVKYLFDAGRGLKVESVYIPDKERATLCVSSQAGCRMNCYFCATGRMGFKGQLSAAQIMNQILSIPPAGSNEMPLTNIVFMGMGEPLDNLPNVLRSIEILTAPWGFGWSPKRITVSTVGKLTELKELLEKTQVHVAVSVHSAVAEERESLMPVQKAYPISAVMKLLKGYDFAHQRRLSLEYIMWRNVNDDLRHADALAALCAGVDCRINLIPYHPTGADNLYPSSEEKMIIFRNYLNSKGITSTIRTSRGMDIDAACGMLAAKDGKNL